MSRYFKSLHLDNFDSSIILPFLCGLTLRNVILMARSWSHFRRKLNISDIFNPSNIHYWTDWNKGWERDCWYSEPSLISISPVHLTYLPFCLRKTKQCHDIEGEGEGKLGNQMCSIETLTCWKVWAAIHQRLYATCVWEKPLVCTKILICHNNIIFNPKQHLECNHEDANHDEVSELLTAIMYWFSDFVYTHIPFLYLLDSSSNKQSKKQTNNKMGCKIWCWIVCCSWGLCGSLWGVLGSRG